MFWFNYLKGREPATSRIKAATPLELAIPSLVAYELEYGTLKTRNTRRRAILNQVLAELEEVPFDREAAIESARIRVELESRGEVIGPMDLMIAGTAVSRGAILVTNNVKEFSRIRTLRLADWTK